MKGAYRCQKDCSTVGLCAKVYGRIGKQAKSQISQLLLNKISDDQLLFYLCQCLSKVQMKFCCGNYLHFFYFLF